jgi:hypothetical protein
MLYEMTTTQLKLQNINYNFRSVVFYVGVTFRAKHYNTVRKDVAYNRWTNLWIWNLVNRCKDIDHTFSWLHFLRNEIDCFSVRHFVFLGNGARCVTIWSSSAYRCRREDTTFVVLFRVLSCINIIRIVTAVFEYIAILFWEAFLMSSNFGAGMFIFIERRAAVYKLLHAQYQ